MAGMNLGSDAGESLFCTSCLSRSESGAPVYTPLHSTSPFFFTEQMKLINASFCPFLIRSSLSMRSIREFGPFPIKIGRYTGKLAVCVDGTSVTCDQATPTIDIKAMKENPNTRMARYASGVQEFFKHELAKFRYPKGLTCHGLSSSGIRPVTIHVVKSNVHSTGRPLRKPGIHRAFANTSFAAAPTPKPAGSSTLILKSF